MSRTKNISLIFFLAVIVLSFVQYMLFTSNQTYLDSLTEHETQDRQMRELSVVMKLMLDVETSTRGFILTGNEEFLLPRNEAEKQIDSEMAKLNLILDKKAFTRLSYLVRSRLSQAEKLIAMKKARKPISIEDLNVGRDVMDQIRKEIGQFENKDSDLALKRQALLEDESEYTFILTLTGTIISLTVVLISGIAAINEIRKRSETEKKLALALATSEAIANNVGMGVLAADSVSKIIFANHRALGMTGFKSHEIGFLSLETVLKNFSISGPVLSTLMIPEITLTQNFTLREGVESKTIKLTASPLYIEGRLEGKIISLSDISEEAANIKELDNSKKVAEQASLAKSNFLAKMSHEIRTPLNAILGVGEILQSTQLTTEQQRCMEIFQQSSQTLKNLVNDILDLSKIEAGKLELVHENFSLSNLLASCSSLLDFRASQKGLLFNVQNETTVDHYIGDEGRIRQVILNLVGNAIKFTERGSVTLQVRCFPVGAEQRQLEFKVIDTGKGILPENLDKLFKNYQQESARISSEFGGTGLGLSLSRELAHLMKGDITVDSIYGKGSEFTFTCLLQSSTAPYPKSKIDEKIDLKGMRVLLVDDNPENRFIINRYLIGTGIQIVEADDGLRAFDLYRKETFDLIFMDINMPVMDGIESISKIRAWEKERRLKRTIIIALSANAMSQDYQRALEAGCDDYLTKPLPRMKLFSTLKKWKEINQHQDLQMSNDDFEEIDEDILAMVPQYLENRRSDLKLIEEALAKKDLTVLNRIGHNISGTAHSYGQYSLEKIARRFYQAVKEEDWDGIIASKMELEKLLNT